MKGNTVHYGLKGDVIFGVRCGIVFAFDMYFNGSLYFMESDYVIR